MPTKRQEELLRKVDELATELATYPHGYYDIRNKIRKLVDEASLSGAITATKILVTKEET